MANYPISASKINIHNMYTIPFIDNSANWKDVGEPWTLNNFDTSQVSYFKRLISKNPNDAIYEGVGDTVTEQTGDSLRYLNGIVVDGILCPKPHPNYITSGVKDRTIGFYSRIDFQRPLLIPRYYPYTEDGYQNAYHKISYINRTTTYSQQWDARAVGRYVDENGEDDGIVNIRVNPKRGTSYYGYGGLSIDPCTGLSQNRKTPLNTSYVYNQGQLIWRIQNKFPNAPLIQSFVASQVFEYGALEIYPPTMFIGSTSFNPSMYNPPFRICAVGLDYNSNKLYVYNGSINVAGNLYSYSQSSPNTELCWYLPFLSHEERKAAIACNCAWMEHALDLYKNDPNRS